MVFLFLGKISSQNILPCGSEGLSPQDREAILSSIPPEQIAAMTSSPWKISIWIYHLRFSDGTTSPFLQNFDPDQNLPIINQHYSGLFEFTICGITDINDDQFAWLDLSSGSSDFQQLNAYIAGLNNPLADNCVRLFLVGSQLIQTSPTEGVAGYAYDRIDHGENAAVFVGTPNPEVWSHELGHYFGLPHTHLGGLSGQYEDSPVVIGGTQFSCYRTGDGFCDTPADVSECVPQGVNGGCIPFTCTETDPLGVNYHPDPTLLMSYYENCRNRFSGEQMQFMRVLYTLHPAYEPIRTPKPECIYPKYGLIERECVDNQFASSFEALADVNVSERDGGSTICNDQTDNFGRYLIEPCTNYNGPARKVIPDKNYTPPLNGVTTYDLVLLSQYILGAIPFTPYQKIGADANNSGSITTYDIITIRKIILGIENNMPAGSWRYVPRFATTTQVFYDQFSDDNPFDAVFNDPFQSGFTRYYLSAQGNIPNSDSWMDFVSLNTSDPLTQNTSAWSLVGIKVGDLNCTAIVNGIPPEPQVDHAFLTVPGENYALTTGMIKKLKITASAPEPVVAWQFGAVFPADSISLLNIYPGNTGTEFDAGNFHSGVTSGNPGTGFLNAIWFSPDGSEVDIDGKTLFEIEIGGNLRNTPLYQSFLLSNNRLPLKFYNAAGEEISNVELTLALDTIEGHERNSREFQNANSGLLSESVHVYPVPFKSSINFGIELSSDSDVKVTLFNLCGEEVVSQNYSLPKGRNEVSVAGLETLSSGLYSYSIVTAGNHYTGKIVKF